MDTCNICKFWLPVSEVLNEEKNLLNCGFCRRYPPNLNKPMTDEAKASWEEINQHRYVYYIETLPFTTDDFWCGEFKSR